MAGGRTLKLSILGDVDNLNKSLAAGSKDVDSFGDKVGKAGKAIGTAFVAAAAAAGAAAIAIGVDAVKAAIEDEKAQTQLALALKNSAGATDAQVASTEAAILKMSLASGVADDVMRPSLARLSRATGDTEIAQTLLAQAMDISAATGKPLETVANALGKAYEGNAAGLGKLGLGLDAAELKTMTFTDVQGKLTDLFGGAAAANADTYAGKIERMQVGFSEAKETLGVALLPLMDTAMKFINETALPALTKFTDSFSLDKGLGKTIGDVANTIKVIAMPIWEAMKGNFDKIKKVIDDNKESFQSFWEVIKFVAPLIGKVIGKAVEIIGTVVGTVIDLIGTIMSAVKPILNAIITSINVIISGINLVKSGADIPQIPKIGATSNPGGVSSSAATSLAKSFSNSIPGRALGGSVSSGSPYIVGERGAELFVPNTSGSIVPNNKMGSGMVINLTVNGALDSESTARQIVAILNDSFYRGTGGGSSLVMA